MAQWATLLLELNLMTKSWAKFGPEIELQAPCVKRILSAGTTNHKPQAPSRKRHTIAMYR